MGNQSTESSTDNNDDFFEPLLADLSDELFEDACHLSSEKQRLAAKRRRAEQKLEERRLREELGDYDFELDDF